MSSLFLLRKSSSSFSFSSPLYKRLASLSALSHLFPSSLINPISDSRNAFPTSQDRNFTTKIAIPPVWTVTREFHSGLPLQSAGSAVEDFSDDDKKGNHEAADDGLEISKLGISNDIVSALAKKGITRLFPIQAHACIINLENKPRSSTMEEERTIYPDIPQAYYECDVLKTSIQKSHPPHYTLKIDSYSFLLEVLQKEGKICYDSNIFKASDYEWKLSVYPNGDKVRNGKDISLYLSIQGTNSLPQGWEVNANFKFFLYDQIRDQYLTFQDASGKSKRFHEMKKEWGISQLLDLNVFKDATKGYLLEDKCVFGVEILASGNRGTVECVALPEKLCSSSYTWQIPNFSKSGNCVYSEDFILENTNWKLCVYPKGDSKYKDKSLSVYLYLSKPQTGVEVFAEYKLSIKDQKNGKDIEYSISHTFSSSSTNWGWPDFVSLDDIKDSSKGFLVKDTLIAQVEIIRISTMKDCY